jgi:hypothetical protein
MDTFFLLAGKTTAFVGGFGFLGAIIDLAIRKPERARIYDWLTRWWIQFDNMTLKRFGQTEARLVVDYIDTHAGPSLWSMKRWRFVGKVSLWCTTLSVLLTLVRVPFRQILESASPMQSGGAFLIEALSVVIIVVGFGASISVTRFIARLMATLCTGPVVSVVAFSGLLIAHVALLLLWTEGLLNASIIFLRIVADDLMSGTHTLLADASESAGDKVYAYLEHYLADVLPKADVSEIWPGLFAHRSITNAYPLTISTFSDLMDLLANGVRIAFAIVFLGSFMMPAIIKDLVSRIWEGIIETERPLFTITFGLLGFFALIAYSIVQ